MSSLHPRGFTPPLGRGGAGSLCACVIFHSVCKIPLAWAPRHRRVIYKHKFIQLFAAFSPLPPHRQPHHTHHSFSSLPTLYSSTMTNPWNRPLDDLEITDADQAR